MTKTLGQVAEHAYDSCPDSDEDVCWQAAAEEVARAAVAEVQTQVSNLHPERYEAVIEAAKAVVADLPMIEGEPVPYPFAKSLHAQKRAVEALEEVEGG